MFPVNLFHYRIFRYAIVGGVAFVADAGVLYILTAFIQINYLFSAAVGFIIGLAVNYYLSLQFVFEDMERSTHWTFELFFLIGIVGLILTELILVLFTEVFEFHYMISKLFAVFLVFLWNYGARRKLCFCDMKHA